MTKENSNSNINQDDQSDLSEANQKAVKNGNQKQVVNNNFQANTQNFNSQSISKFQKFRRIIFEYFLSEKNNKMQLKWWTTFLFELVLFGSSIVNITTLVVAQDSYIRNVSLLPYYFFLIVLYFFDWILKWSFANFYYPGIRYYSKSKIKPYIRYTFSPIWIINLVVWLLPLILIINNWNYVEVRKVIVPLFLLIKSLIVFNLLIILSKKYQNYKILINIINKSFRIIFFIIIFMAILTMIFAVFVFNLGIIGTKVDDEKVVTIKSFFDAYWMSFLTITTIGYGDVVPVTYSGRIVVMILSIMGIAFYSLLTSIIVNGFSKYLDAIRANKEKRMAKDNQMMFEKYKEEIQQQIEVLKDHLSQNSNYNEQDEDTKNEHHQELMQKIIKDLKRNEIKSKLNLEKTFSKVKILKPKNTNTTKPINKNNDSINKG